MIQLMLQYFSPLFLLGLFSKAIDWLVLLRPVSKKKKVLCVIIELLCLTVGYLFVVLFSAYFIDSGSSMDRLIFALAVLPLVSAGGLIALFYFIEIKFVAGFSAIKVIEKLMKTNILLSPILIITQFVCSVVLLDWGLIDVFSQTHKLIILLVPYVSMLFCVAVKLIKSIHINTIQIHNGSNNDQQET